MNILRSVKLRKSFGKLVAVNDVSADFREGELVAIIGPNGAGKSTYFNLISGRFKPSSGQLYFREKNITGFPPHRIARNGIGRSFQITNIFHGLTTFENIRIGIIAHTKKSGNFVFQVEKMKDVNERALQGLEAVGLEGEKDTVAGALSHGDQRRLEIGLTLTSEPTVMLLDEPTAGMNPEETRMLTNLISDIAHKRGVTVIFTEHDMNVVFDISERIIVLQQGRIIADGKKSDIRSDEIVKEAYLGVSK